MSKATKSWTLHENCHKRTRMDINVPTTHRIRRSCRALIIKNYLSAMHIDRERNPEEKRMDTQSAFQRLNHYMYLQHILELYPFIYLFVEMCTGSMQYAEFFICFYTGSRIKISNKCYILITCKISLYCICNFFSYRSYIKIIDIFKRQ